MSQNEKNPGVKADGRDGAPSGFKSYLRISNYADRTSWLLYAVSFIATLAFGTTLPLMDLVFGKFVTTFNNFAIGAVGPDEYKDQVSHYT
jgi:ATP-binding cassette subfamily B (MDR/TAP) protein 1